jgi:hypothetical protein
MSYVFSALKAFSRHLPAIVPVTVLSTSPRQEPTDVPYHPSYHGSVLFRNTFDGKLPATDYPKVNVSEHRHICAS